MIILTRDEFLRTESGVYARQELQRMVSSSTYNTRDAYDINSERSMAFIDRHLTYLAKHPLVSPVVYLSNLRVMTKSKR